MKRILPLLLCLLLIGNGLAEESLRFETVGMASNGDHIRRCVLPSGQPLYFTSLDDDNRYEWADINFDGHDDLVIHVASGATNRFSEFFLFEPETGWYSQVAHIGLEDGFANYALRDGYIVSHRNDGAAGLLHEISIFRWEDGRMRQLRQAISRTKEDFAVTDTGYVITACNDLVELSVTDYTLGTAGGETIWSRTLQVGAAEELDVLEEEQTILWQGLV